MNTMYYYNLADTALDENPIEPEVASEILNSENIELMPLLNAAYEVRKHFCGKSVTIHIINNAQNGHCPEDCHYCAQAKTSKADIEEYPLKSDDEFLAEAKRAYGSGAHRYCMVFAGRGPSQKRVEHLAQLIKKIKSRYNLEICVSPGLLDQEKAKILKEAGLNRLNHNLNTSKSHYKNICTTHTFEDRLNTLKSAKKAGLDLCSGVIIGMKESSKDIIEAAFTLRDLEIASIPINFLIPIDGNVLSENPHLTPEFCLKVLCLFRLINPKAEIRMAAGREIYLRDMQALGLYPANSLFLDGYLNVKGGDAQKTLQMIKDAGFSIQSDISLNEILNNTVANNSSSHRSKTSDLILKDVRDLRPARK